jgi:hypothetical protein
MITHQLISQLRPTSGGILALHLRSQRTISASRRHRWRYYLEKIVDEDSYGFIVHLCAGKKLLLD